jgi:hypothetical protein
LTTKSVAGAELDEPQRLCTQSSNVAHGQKADTPPTAITAAKGLFRFAETALATVEQDCCSSALAVEQFQEPDDGPYDGVPTTGVGIATLDGVTEAATLNDFSWSRPASDSFCEVIVARAKGARHQNSSTRARSR